MYLEVKGSSFPLGGRPFGVLEFKTSLHPWDRDCSPYTRPEKWESPANLASLDLRVKLEVGCTYYVGSVSLDGPDDRVRDCSTEDCTDGPEECQPVQHLSERLASLVTQIESLSELGPS